MSDVTDLKAEVLLLRQENKELRAEQAHWELGNCPNCPNIANLQEALEQNAKLRELMYQRAHVYAIQNMTEDELRITATYVMEDNAKLRELCGRALIVIENNCSECAYFYECDIVTDCKCVAPMKIRDELRELGVTA